LDCDFFRRPVDPAVGLAAAVSSSLTRRSISSAAALPPSSEASRPSKAAAGRSPLRPPPQRMGDRRVRIPIPRRVDDLLSAAASSANRRASASAVRRPAGPRRPPPPCPRASTGDPSVAFDGSDRLAGVSSSPGSLYGPPAGRGKAIDPFHPTLSCGVSVAAHTQQLPQNTPRAPHSRASHGPCDTRRTPGGAALPPVPQRPDLPPQPGGLRLQQPHPPLPLRGPRLHHSSPVLRGQAHARQPSYRWSHP